MNSLLYCETCFNYPDFTEAILEPFDLEDVLVALVAIKDHLTEF